MTEFNTQEDNLEDYPKNVGKPFEEQKTILDRVVYMVMTNVQLGGKETKSVILADKEDTEATKELHELTEEAVIKELPEEYYTSRVDHVDLDTRFDGNANAVYITTYLK